MVKCIHKPIDTAVMGKGQEIRLGQAWCRRCGKTLGYLNMERLKEWLIKEQGIKGYEGNIDKTYKAR